MRLGLNFTPPHETPEEWADILIERGYRAASFPVNYKAPAHVIDAYVKAAAERDIMIAEVGGMEFAPSPGSGAGGSCQGSLSGAAPAG